MEKTLVSIIIPVKDLTDYLIDENLASWQNQTYKNFEVIVLPNYQSSLDNKLTKQYSWLKIIPTKKITRPAKKRDMGVKTAKGNIVAFIDDDAYPDKNWLKNAVDLFLKNKASAICGPGILPKKTSIWEKIFDLVLTSSIGSGGFVYRFTQKKERYVDDYPSMNFFIKKDVFVKLGGFDSKYWPGEDSKLCEDLVYKEKGEIFYHPSVLVYHHRRNNLLGYLKQHANYGYHRGAFFSHGDKNSLRLTYVIPSLFVLYLVFLIFVTLLHVTMFIFPLLLYLLLLFYLFLSSLLTSRNFLISITTPLVLFLTHLTYGIMFIKGFFIGLFKKEKIY